MRIVLAALAVVLLSSCGSADPPAATTAPRADDTSLPSPAVTDDVDSGAEDCAALPGLDAISTIWGVEAIASVSISEYEAGFSCTFKADQGYPLWVLQIQDIPLAGGPASSGQPPDEFGGFLGQSLAYELEGAAGRWGILSGPTAVPEDIAEYAPWLIDVLANVDVYFPGR